MRRRDLLISLGGAVAAAGPAARAQQQPARVPRIGLAGGLDAVSSRPFIAPFLGGLSELGYVEGSTIKIEYRWAEGHFERFPALVADLVRLKVDLIVASVDAAALAAKNATNTIPIVTVAVSDPIALGLVDNLGRPGGNITGLTSLSLDLSAKQLELLNEAAPAASEIAILVNAANPGMVQQMQETRSAAEKLGVRLQVLNVRGVPDLEGAFAAVDKERVRAILILADPLFFPMRRQILDLAAKLRLPAMHGFREFTDAGGLMSYGVNLPNNYRRAASYVDRILKGAQAGALPIEQPTKFELIVNLKTAKALGLAIPQSILARADEVIE